MRDKRHRTAPKVDSHLGVLWAIPALIALVVDPRLGGLLIGCVIVRALCGKSEALLAKVLKPLATTWTIALAILLSVETVVSLLLSRGANLESADVALSAYEVTVIRAGEILSRAKLAWGWMVASLAMAMLVAVALPKVKPVTFLAAAVKWIGHIAAVVAVLSSFTFFGRTEAPNFTERIERMKTDARQAKIQAQFDASVRNEQEIWRRYFAKAVLERALKDPVVAPQLVAMAVAVAEVSKDHHREILQGAVDLDATPITSFEEDRKITELEALISTVPSRWAMPDEKNEWHEKVREQFGPRRHVWPDPIEPFVSSLTEQLQREAAAKAAEGELDEGFQRLITKTVDAPRRAAFDVFAKELIEALAGDAGPLVGEILRTTADGLTQELVARITKPYVDEAVARLRKRYWSIQPAVEEVHAREHVQEVRDVVELAVSAYDTAELARLKKSQSEAEKAEELAKRAEQKAEALSSSMPEHFNSFSLRTMTYDIHSIAETAKQEAVEAKEIKAKEMEVRRIRP